MDHDDLEIDAAVFTPDYGPGLAVKRPSRMLGAVRRLGWIASLWIAGCSLTIGEYTFGSDGGATDAGATDAGADASVRVDGGVDAAAPSDAGSDAGADDAGFVDAGPPPAVVEVALGDRHACARLEDGTVRCWGSNEFGQLGDGTMVDRHVPTPIALTGVVQLDLGFGTSCARLGGGELRCWGDNRRGQLGDGSGLNRNVPTRVVGISDAIDIDAGWDYTCAARSGGAIDCWGAHDYLTYGPDRTTDSSVPINIAAVTGAVQLSTYGPKCYVDTGSDAFCWGTNGSGELGDGTLVNRPEPVRVLVEMGGSSEVASTAFTACVRMRDGTVYSFGSRDGMAYPVPYDLGVTGAAALSGGHQHFCLIRQPGGQVMCWGRNDSGELGIGTRTWRNNPTLVPLTPEATQVSAGQFFTCAVSDGGELYCWGENENGQLGIGTTDDELSPVLVPMD